MHVIQLSNANPIKFMILTNHIVYKFVLCHGAHFHQIGICVDAGTISPSAVPAHPCGIVVVAVILIVQGETARTTRSVHCMKENNTLNVAFLVEEAKTNQILRAPAKIKSFT